MIIPDLNLLVYAYNSDAPYRQQAKAWWEHLVIGSQQMFLSGVFALLPSIPVVGVPGPPGPGAAMLPS